MLELFLPPLQLLEVGLYLFECLAELFDGLQVLDRQSTEVAVADLYNYLAVFGLDVVVEYPVRPLLELV